MLTGMGVSDGMGIGHVLVIGNKNMADTAYVNSHYKFGAFEASSEKRYFENARKRFAKDINDVTDGFQRKTENDNNVYMILKNQINIVNDEEFIAGVYERIENKHMTAVSAVEEVCSMYADIFAAMESEVMNQRAADIRDVCIRLVNILLGNENVNLSNLSENTVIVAYELLPSMTAAMDTKHVTAIVAEKGGETSHAAILARALGIPAVLNVPEIFAKVSDGDDIIVDGSDGVVYVSPSKEEYKICSEKKREYDAHKEMLKYYADKDTETKDGRHICLMANIGSDEECVKAVRLGAEGIGLFRTEFFFLEGSSMPTEEKQFESYRHAAMVSKGKTVTIRTLDVGGDKDIPYLGLVKEDNPFLGFRAIRYCLARKDIFYTQLRAIIRASAYGKIRIMIPFVTNIGELEETKKIIAQICTEFDKSGVDYNRDIQTGVMMETPAAAVAADILAKRSDFFSIGTNDLTQYTLAVDRGNEKAAYLYSVFNPSVLRLIKHIIVSAKNAGIDAGMCGEAAADARMIPLLISFGLDEFSVSPSRILETRRNIARWTVSEADEVADMVMKMDSEDEITGYLEKIIKEKEERG